MRMFWTKEDKLHNRTETYYVVPGSVNMIKVHVEHCFN